MFEKIKKIIADKLDVELEQIVPEASMIDDLGADSLDLVDLVMAIEDELCIEIGDEKLAEIKTVQDIINYIEANQKSKQ